MSTSPLNHEQEYAIGCVLKAQEHLLSNEARLAIQRFNTCEAPQMERSPALNMQPLEIAIEGSSPESRIRASGALPRILVESEALLGSPFPINPKAAVQRMLELGLFELCKLDLDRLIRQINWVMLDGASAELYISQVFLDEECANYVLVGRDGPLPECLCELDDMIEFAPDQPTDITSYQMQGVRLTPKGWAWHNGLKRVGYPAEPPIRKTESAEQDETDDQTTGNSHSPDFRSVTWDGVKYTFTPNQAAVVKQLWMAWTSGNLEIGDDHLMETASIEARRLIDTFRDHPAWGRMIVTGSRRGTRRLKSQ